MSSSTKWADVEEKTDLKEKSAPVETKENKDGERTIVEYYYNEKGQKVRVTRVVKSVKKQVTVNMKVAARRKWEKFGDCKDIPPGPEVNITARGHENIKLVLKLTTDNEKTEKEEVDDPLLSLSKEDKKIVKCKNCGEYGHFSLKCPKRNHVMPGVSYTETKEAPADDGKEKKYVPSHILNKTAAAEAQRDNEATLRVTNLSEDTTEDDLAELFKPFGQTRRIFLAKDKIANKSRGFAFISYYDRTAAEHAISKLHGYGYDNLILSVEWAKPQAARPSGGGGGGGAEKAPEPQRKRLQLQPRSVGK